MNILLIAPNEVEVPPYQGYGGTERVIYDLALQAASRGHKTDIICKDGSAAPGKHIRMIPYPEGQSKQQELEFIGRYINKYRDKYHVVNLHIFETQYVQQLSRLFTPLVTSIHYYIDEDRIRPFSKLNSYYLVQSKSQERFFRPHLGNKVKGILQGIRTEHIPHARKTFAETEKHELNLKFLKDLKKAGIQHYLLILSKISRRKGQLTAIKLSKQLSIPLVIAGEPKNDYEGAHLSSVAYFKQSIQPLVDNQQIFYFGNADEQEKYELMKHASAFILPTGFEDEWWNEAFGRVVAESLAAGTPVVAHKNGAMQEQIINGRNGFLFTTFDEAVKQLEKVHTLSRKFCRQDALKRLGSGRFADECLTYFGELVEKAEKINTEVSKTASAN